MDGGTMKRILFGIFAVAALTGVVQAQDDDYNDPSRGIARISIQQGDVSVRRGDSGEVTAAALNAPLMSQDAIRTGDASRAEIQFDATHFLRVAPNSEVHFADIEQGRFQAQVAAGTITLTAMAQTQVQAELDTPSIGLRPNGPGAFRVTVNPDGTSQITVRSGQAEVFTPQGSETIREGETMTVRGPASDPEFQTAAAIAMDDWDQWNQECDQRIEHAQQAQREYVSPDEYGTESMAGYGTWGQDPDYGPVWYPTVAPGWAPYRYGRWVWMDWYGWTWVSYDPWGWAPYHWGRWFYGTRGWGWYPGPRYGYHHWSPALVAFFGFGGRGGGFGVGFGFGNVGWVPLGPREPFNRWWGRGYYHGHTNIAVVNNVNIINTYRNARVMNGVTAVGAGDFGRRGFNGNNIRVTAGDLRGAGLVRGQVPLAPARESLRMSDRPVRTTNFTQGRQFFSHMQARPVERVPFTAQQRGMEQNVQHGVSSGTAVQGSASPGRWRRVGDPAPAARGTGEQYRPSGPAPSSGTPGWHRFEGSPSGGRESSAPPARSPERYSPPSGRDYGVSSGGGQPVRISPQIVRERPSSGGGGGGYAPPPSYHGGGGGGGERGGSGGGHTSGGGGGDHGGGGGGGHSSGGGGGGGNSGGGHSGHR